MSTNAENLGYWVRTRREALDLSQLDVWQTGGPSNTTLTKIEGGLLEALSAATARKLDAGLLWEPGSARRVWNGGEPTNLEDLGRRDARWLRERIDEAEISAALRMRLLAAFEQRGERGDVG